MKIFVNKNFVKKYNKLQSSDKKRFKIRRNIFLQDPYNPVLNNHSLHGKYVGYRSISVTGNLRIIYKFLGKNTVLFVEIGTHSDLYS